MREVMKLSTLANLKNLTMNGNPLEQIPSYRFWIIALMPTITKLDTTLVTKMERYSADFWAESNHARSRRRKLPRLENPPLPPPIQAQSQNKDGDSQGQGKPAAPQAK
jgi:hypothetical protein